MIATFASQSNPTRRYRWDSDRYDYHRRGAWERVTWFDTLGDGEIQHTPDGPINDKMLGDAMASFAIWAQTAELTADDISTLSSRLPNTWNGDGRLWRAIEFIRTSASWKEPADEAKYTAPRYYTIRDERKGFAVSSSESKKHDKRWYEITRYNDGGLSDIVARLHRQGNDGDTTPRYTDSCHYWVAVDQVRDIVAQQSGEWINLPDDNISDFANRRYRDLADAISMFRRACDMIRHTDYLNRGVECWKHNHQPKDLAQTA